MTLIFGVVGFYRKTEQKGIGDEAVFWQTFFDDGYDAVIGYDSYNSTVLDVIVNPKHLGNS